MKKILNKKIVISLLLTVFCCFISSGQALALDMTQENTKNIKQTIGKYFDNNFKLLEGNKDVNYDDIINNSNFKKVVDLRTQFALTLNNKLNRNVESIVYNIDYNSININNNECIVNLHLDTKKEYTKNSQKIVDTDDQNHILLLKKFNNRWFIESDAFDPLINLDESIVKNSNYIKNEINTLKDAIQDIDNRVKAINSLKNISTREKRSAQHYDRSAAARYAETYAHSRNPRYPNFDGNGGDCTNFVSQCLANANIPSSNSGEWYCRKNSSGGWNYGVNWIRVNGLHKYLTENGLASSNVYSKNSLSSLSSKAKVGDVLQLRNKNNHIYYHSIIINQISNGDIYYCAHSGDVRTGSYRIKILENYTCDKVRLLHITY